jgi:hypothetical protein
MAENYSKHGKVAIVGGGRNSGRVLKAHIDLLEELQAYREIGTIEEFKALKEKNVAKKVIFAKNIMTKEKACYCPSCKRIVESIHIHCWNCGQKLDWN